MTTTPAPRSRHFRVLTAIATLALGSVLGAAAVITHEDGTFAGALPTSTVTAAPEGRLPSSSPTTRVVPPVATRAPTVTAAASPTTVVASAPAPTGVSTAAASPTTVPTAASTAPSLPPSATPTAAVPDPTISAPPDAPSGSVVHRTVGYLSVDTTGGDAQGLHDRRLDVLRSAVEQLEEGTNGQLSFGIVDLGAVDQPLTDEERLMVQDIGVDMELKRDLAGPFATAAVDSVGAHEVPDLYAVAMRLDVPQEQGLSLGLQAYSPDDTVAYAVEFNEPFNMIGAADPTVFMHELLHAVVAVDPTTRSVNPHSVSHANQLSCDSLWTQLEKPEPLPLTLTTRGSETCTSIEYADESSVMSSGQRLDLDPLNVVALQQIGLLTDDQVLRVAGPGTETVSLSTLRSSGAGTKLIRIDGPKDLAPPLGVPALYETGIMAYSWVLELSSDPDDQRADIYRPTVKVMLVGYGADDLPVGGSHAVSLRYGVDPGAPAGQIGAIFRDSRIGLTIEQLGTENTGDDAMAQVRITIKEG